MGYLNPSLIYVRARLQWVHEAIPCTRLSTLCERKQAGILGGNAAISAASAAGSWGMTSEPTEGGASASESASPPPNGSGRLVVGRPFQPGVSGNPLGRPRIEPRVRRYARKYDRRAVKELWRRGSDPKTPPDVARRTLMDLIAIGSGRPTLVQEVAGRDGAPLSPLVQLNFPQPGAQLSPEAAYKFMLNGTIPLDPAHEAFHRPPIEAQAVSGDAGAAYSPAQSESTPAPEATSP
jgi:hypothetical protein